MNAGSVTYFDSFKHIPKEIRKFIGNTNNITDKYRIQAYDLIMCECFCIWFIDFKSLLEYINLFSLNEYKKNDTIKLKCF